MLVLKISVHATQEEPLKSFPVSHWKILFPAPKAWETAEVSRYTPRLIQLFCLLVGLIFFPFFFFFLKREEMLN